MNMRKNGICLFREAEMGFWYFDDIKSKTATRNDFMSHGAYAFLGTMLLMAGSTFRTVDPVILSAIGFIGGMIGVMLRETYDELVGVGW